MGLNDQQFKAATSEAESILCLAGAGAGKTKTLLARIEHLTKKGVDPKSILAITFTNAAAFEMKQRYKMLPGLDLSRGEPEFRTFHSFCYSLIIKDQKIRERLGYTKVPEVCNDTYMKQLRERIKLQLGCKLTDKELEPSTVLISRSKQEQRELFHKALKKTIKKENIITFDIMCYNVCALFEKDDPCIQFYKQKYKYLFCDEFQDVDPKQFKFIASFPKGTHIYLCGDSLQCIYQFRNCSNEYIKVLSNTPGWEVIKLYKNYRSTTNICEFANKFSKYADDRYRIAMEGQRDGEDVVQIYGASSSYSSPVDEGHLRRLIKMLKEHTADCAVLCRTNKECNAVKAALAEEDIEYSTSNKHSDSINLLNCALDNDYMLGWLASQLDTYDYGNYIRLSALQENPDIRWFLKTYNHKTKIHDLAKKISKIREVSTSDNLPKDKLKEITKLLKLKTKFDPEEFPQGNKSFLEYLRDKLQEVEETQIYVGTIHSSKGLEYDSVYVMGVNDKSFQLGGEEMNNLYYVAITRAKNHLTIFRS